MGDLKYTALEAKKLLESNRLQLLEKENRLYKIIIGHINDKIEHSIENNRTSASISLQDASPEYKFLSSGARKSLTDRVFAVLNEHGYKINSPYGSESTLTMNISWS